MTPTPLNVLYLCGEPDRPERALLGGLQAAGVRTTVVCDPKAAAALERVVGAVEPLRFRARIDLGAAARIRALIHRNRPQIIHAFTARALTAGVLGSIGMGTPLVAYRGTMGNVHRLDPSSWLSFLNPKVARVLCVSEAVCRDLQRVCRPGVATTVYKGHDLAWYRDIRPIERQALGLPTDLPLVSCTANMRPLKGVDVLIRAFSQLKSTAHLVLIGEVRDPALRPLVAQLGLESRVHFTGFRSDALQIVAASDLFVMPSTRREGFPKAVIEALALGKPCVVSDVGGLPELVQDGQQGYVVPACNDRALAEALERLLSDVSLRTKMGAAGPQRIDQHFHIASTISQTLQEYRAVLRQ